MYRNHIAPPSIVLLGLMATGTPSHGTAGALDSEERAAVEAREQREDTGRPRRTVVHRVAREGEPLAWTLGDADPSELRDRDSRKGYLGIGTMRMTPELREHFGAPANQGVMLDKIVEESPAAVAGLAVGDIVLAVEGEVIGSERDLIRQIGGRERGDVVAIEVLRNGQTFSLSATLEERQRRVLNLMPDLNLDRARIAAQLRNIPDSKELERMIEIRGADIERALGDVQKYLNSPEFRQQIEEATRRSAELEQRTAELEKRLLELQRQLQAMGEPNG